MKIRKQTKRWTTKEGVKIRVCDMEDSHLRNTIYMLRRRLEYLRENALRLLALDYPNFNGEMAQECAEREWEMLTEELSSATTDELGDVLSSFLAEGEDDSVFSIFNALILDAERRGLSLAPPQEGCSERQATMHLSELVRRVKR